MFSSAIKNLDKRFFNTDKCEPLSGHYVDFTDGKEFATPSVSITRKILKTEQGANFIKMK
jgi:hypothetical protein